MATIAVYGNNVYVAYQGISGNKPEILFRKSTDGGATFGSVVNLSNTPALSYDPAITVSGDNVYLVWQDQPSGNNEILFRKSADGGTTFGNAINVSATGGWSLDAGIAVSGNNLYVIWLELRDEGGPEILFRRSLNDGATFGSVGVIANLNGNLGVSFNPVIATSRMRSKNKVYVAWTDSLSLEGNPKILFRRSSIDGGSTFGNIKYLSTPAGFSLYPAVATYGDKVYVVWFYGSPNWNFEILFKRSIDSGATFENVVNLINNDASDEFPPVVAAFGNNVYVTWTDYSSGNYEILFRRSIDSGATFENVVNLSNSSVDSVIPAVAAFGNNVYVLWGETATGILLTRSVDGGATLAM